MKKQRINNHYLINLGCTITFISFIIAAGCESTNPLTQSNNIIFPDSNVSYHQYVQPVFDLNCTYSGCHDDASKAAGLSLTNWSNANADPGNIIPFDTLHSKLNQVLTRRFGHSGGSLDTNQNHVRGIARWVLEGGKNN